MNTKNTIAMVSLLTLAPLAAEAIMISFQEGVSPTGAYTQDAVYIRESEPTTNQNMDPDQEIIVGFTDGDDLELRGLFEFDISAIPAGNTIDSVSLGLHTGGGLSSSITINLYEYGSNFDEGVATWNAPAPGDVTAGGTLGTFLTSATFNPTVTADILFDTTPAFQSAVSSALAGDGFLRFMLARSDDSGTGHRFARFDDETVDTEGNRPELTVQHSVAAVPEPSTSIPLILLGAAALTARRRLQHNQPPRK